QRVRIELSERETSKVTEAAQQWVKQFNVETKEGAHAMLEALWLHQQHNVVNRELLKKLLQSPIQHARIAAQRVKWEWNNKPRSNQAESMQQHAAQSKENAGEESMEIGRIIDLTD